MRAVAVVVAGGAAAAAAAATVVVVSGVGGVLPRYTAGGPLLRELGGAVLFFSTVPVAAVTPIAAADPVVWTRKSSARVTSTSCCSLPMARLPISYQGRTSARERESEGEGERGGGGR